jgi:hypothetical protein
MDWAEGEPPIAHAEVLDLAAGMAARASISASRAGGRADISDIEREADFAEAMAVREGWLAGQELAGERRQWRKAKRRAFREHTRKTSLGGHRVTAKEKKERRRWRRQNPKP